MEKVVFDSIQIKANVVNKDEREGGERRKLNFGHTLGHAIEKSFPISHGEAVSLGMVAAMELSIVMGSFTQDKKDRVIDLLGKLNLPNSFSDWIKNSGRSPNDVLSLLQDGIRKDKKRYGTSVKFVLLKDIGESYIQDIPLTELDKSLEKLINMG
jgi:3-dehydroquinate synthase